MRKLLMWLVAAQPVCWRVALGALVLAVLLAGQGQAAIRIDLNNPNAAPIPVAVPDLYGATPDSAKYAADLAGVITNNLSHSTPFKVLNRKAFTQSPAQMAAQGPAFADWRAIGADALLTGTVEVEGGSIRVEYRLYDPNSETQLAGQRYKVDLKFWRHLAHRISDDIYTAMTGEEGYFATRIVHIGEDRGPDGKTRKRLCVMDQDSANYQCLTDGNSLVLTPR
ncbi:MAG: Tol-Pal system protein TolB, partial [Pseudomonadaceae bacterium]|nr:Tol-Pal system protein TolB [Pseudomonadaceae bacterium]